MVTFVLPSFWILFGIVLSEGLLGNLNAMLTKVDCKLVFILGSYVLGGAAFVNAFYRMSKEVSKNRQSFAMSIVSAADTMGVMLAGIIAIPAHNAICKMPIPN